MISDSERREVARRLRHARTAHEIGEAVGVNCHGGLCNGCASEAAQLLADLIEPPVRSSKDIRAEASRLDWYDLAPKADIQALWDLADQVDAACAPIDRDALLALADEMETADPEDLDVAIDYVTECASRIREALGVSE